MWYETLAGPPLTAFMSMLRAIQPTDPIMVVGTAETELDSISPELKRDLFGSSNSNFVEITRPVKVSPLSFVQQIVIAWLTIYRKIDENTSAGSFHTSEGSLKTFPTPLIERREC